MDDRTRVQQSVSIAFIFAVMACFLANVFLHLSTLMTWVVFFSVLIWMINRDAESWEAIKIERVEMEENRARWKKEEEQRKKDEEQHKKDEELRKKIKEHALINLKEVALPRLIKERAEVLSQVQNIAIDTARQLVESKIEEGYQGCKRLQPRFLTNSMEAAYNDSAKKLDYWLLDLTKSRVSTFSPKDRKKLGEYFKSKGLLFDKEQRKKLEEMRLGTFKDLFLPELISERAEVLSKIKGVSIDRAESLVVSMIEKGSEASSFYKQGYTC